MELTIKKEFKDLIPRLSNEEYELLTKSILSDGCRESILLWNGVIVDGHNRYEICTTNNVEFNTSDIDFTDDDAAKIWIIDNQMGRRNINEWVKFELSSKKKDILLKQGREKQKETLGGFKYESSVLSIIDTTDEKETHSTRKIIAEEIGKSTGWVGMAEVVAKKAPEEIKEKLRKNETTVNKVYKEIKKEKKKEEKIKQFEQASLEYQDENVKIFFEDFREGTKTIEDNSVDAIITDPPYPIEYIDLWADMFAIADRILKPSAFLVTYANHQNLDRIFQLPNSLKYYWIFKLDFTSKPIAMGRNLIATWKPVLIFQKLPFKKIEETLEDNIKESKPFNYDERDMHKSNWGQSLGKFEWIIDKFTKPGDLIVEPFAGTGTTLVASKNMKRRCIGYEIDKTNYESIIKGRIERGE